LIKPARPHKTEREREANWNQNDNDTYPPLWRKGCVKSLRSSYTGLYPQTRGVAALQGTEKPLTAKGTATCAVAERRGITLKGVQDFNLKAKARIRS